MRLAVMSFLCGQNSLASRRGSITDAKSSAERSAARVNDNYAPGPIRSRHT